jgi:thioesterase domain-containing protein
MAAHYLGEIRTVQPRGPYTLAAMCFGVSIAFEIAQQLRAGGEEVAGLFMLDSGFTALRPDTASKGIRVGRVHDPARWLRKGYKAFRYFRSTPRERREFLVRQVNGHAWRRYAPRVYPGTVTLIRSAGHGAQRDWHIESWSALTGGKLVTHVVPGGHTTFLKEPHVGAVAEQIRAVVAPAAAS